MRECNHDVYVVEVHRVELQCDGEHDVKLYIMFMFDADQGNTFDGRLVVKCQDGKLVSQLQMAV
jgi:predicted RNA-binding protein with TRAM domain